VRRLALVALVASCSAGDPAARYLDDAPFRRATLVASLVNPANGYSQLRLAHYATGSDGDWDALPAWNPPVATLEAAGSPRDDERALDLSLARDAAQRLTLGEAAFHRYPMQLWSKPSRNATFVATRLADGSTTTALTCASCHERIVDGAPVAGLANEAIDLGWGPGRIDVALSPEEPIAIPDLRAVALEANWQRDGTVRNDGVIALAVRIETLIINTHGAVVRPPREVTLAIAEWLQTIAPPSPRPPADGSDGVRGTELFGDRCAGCHVPPDFSGPPVALDVVGTDPRVGLSAERGTGGYCAPSLRGVGTRGRLLHDASVADLDALFDPARTVAGHPFGLDLSPADRVALLSYLRTL
jgi:cytochrome c5